MGNVTITPLRYDEVAPNRIMQTFKITMSSSYATNGDTITAGDILKIMSNINDLTKADIILASAGPAGHSIYIDKSAAKVKVFNGTTEISNGTNLSTVICDCVMFYEDAHEFDG